jgi:uncharacterized membrane protein YedE/YeeE
VENFTPLPSLLGGLLIGAASVALLVLAGRIAGISGIVAGILGPSPGDVAWRVAFLVGLLAGGVLMAAVQPELFANTVGRGVVGVGIAGLLVGFGTRLGSGCTSGHGVCGISRLSARSIVATVTFIAAGAATVLIASRLGGGS